MQKRYSIAEAKNRLSHVVHEAEDDGPVELTRRGKTVAVILSSDEYRLLERQGRERREHWLRENRLAIADYNRRVAEQGVFSDDRRRF